MLGVQRAATIMQVFKVTNSEVSIVHEFSSLHADFDHFRNTHIVVVM